MRRLMVVVVFVVSLIPFVAPASGQNTAGQPQVVYGTYRSTYYASFSDWNIFPVLLPMLNADTRLRYEERFDLRPEAQIKGELEGSVGEGIYYVQLPENPTEAAWFDTDNNPATESPVKIFVVGIGNGLIEETHVSRYDFIYSRSLTYNPNTRLWGGKALVWSERPDVTFPFLNGDDNIFYTNDDVMITVPEGWSVVEITADERNGTESVQVYQQTEPQFDLREPQQFEDVDLSELSYADAFNALLDHLERTYVFTDYRGVDWAALRTQYAAKAARVRNDQEYQALLEAALFSFRDGHLAIIGPGIPSWYFGQLGLQVYPVNNELMVIEVNDPSPAATASIRPGTVITAVNGQTGLDFFNRVPRTIYSSGHEAQDLWFRGNLAFRGQPGTHYHLDYRLPDGTTGVADLDTVALSEIGGVPTPNNDRTINYRLLANNVGYIAINNFTSAHVDDLWDAAMQTMLANEVAGIVIDLRNNGGGFSLFANYMFGDFLDADRVSGTEISSLDEDGDGKSDIQTEYYFGRAQIFDPGRVTVLVGPRCFSACEFAAQGFQDMGATVIGHLPSGGAGGGVGASYFLPGGTRIYGMAVVMKLDPDGNVMVEGSGVQPDVLVPFSAAALAAGEDQLLAVATEQLLTAQ